MTIRLSAAIAAAAVLGLAPAAYAGQQGGGKGNNGHQAQNNRQAFKRADENAAFQNGQQGRGNPGFSNGQQGRGNPGSNGRQGRGGRGR